MKGNFLVIYNSRAVNYVRTVLIRLVQASSKIPAIFLSRSNSGKQQRLNHLFYHFRAQVVQATITSSGTTTTSTPMNCSVSHTRY